jgi:hypothetical protein
MVPLLSLWLPIPVSAVFVVVASSFLHIVLPIHRSDYRRLPSEDEVMEALRKFQIPPGDYLAFCTLGLPTAQRRSPGPERTLRTGRASSATVVPGYARATKTILHSIDTPVGRRAYGLRGDKHPAVFPFSWTRS